MFAIYRAPEPFKGIIIGIRYLHIINYRIIANTTKCKAIDLFIRKKSIPCIFNANITKDAAVVCQVRGSSQAIQTQSIAIINPAFNFTDPIYTVVRRIVWSIPQNYQACPVASLRGSSFGGKYDWLGSRAISNYFGTAANYQRPVFIYLAHYLGTRLYRKNGAVCNIHKTPQLISIIGF